MLPEQKALQLIAFTTKDGLFIASKTTRYDGRVPINSNYVINGKEPKATHHKAWFLLPNDTEVKTIEQVVAPKREPDYYTLRDSSLFVEGKIPLNIPYSEVDGYTLCEHVPYEQHKELITVDLNQEYVTPEHLIYSIMQSEAFTKLKLEVIGTPHKLSNKQ